MPRRRARDSLAEPWSLPGAEIGTTERSPSADAADDDRDSLADWLAAGHSVANIGGLQALLQAGQALRGFAELFAGSVASVQARLLMLRTLGERADPPEWTPAEIDAAFAWLDATERDTVLKRLNDHGPLNWDAPSRSYRLASIGRIVLLAVEQVLRVAGEPSESDGADLRFIAGQLAAEKLLGFEQLQSLQLMLGRLVEPGRHRHRLPHRRFLASGAGTLDALAHGR